MPCSYCQTQFTLIKWKSTCTACNQTFCSDCYSSKLCTPCRSVESTGFNDAQLMQCKVKELKNYLLYRDVNVSLYKEKKELVNSILRWHNNMGNNIGSKTKRSPPPTNPTPTGTYPHQSQYNYNNYPRGVYPHSNSDSYMNQTQFQGQRRSAPYPPQGNPRMPQPHSAPMFTPPSNPSFYPSNVPPADVPPSYSRTQQDFPTANDYVSVNGATPTQTTTSFTATSTGVDASGNPTHQFVNVNATTTNQTFVVDNDNNTLQKDSSDISETIPQSPTSDQNSSTENVKKPIGSGLGGKIIIADLSSADQIDLLSNRELKQILTDNFVDYKGVVEKSELLRKVNALYLDKVKNEEEMNAAPNSDVTDAPSNSELDDKTCKICWDSAIDCVFLECGHMATCTNCGKKLSECPICRQYIVRCVHVFRS